MLASKAKEPNNWRRLSTRLLARSLTTFVSEACGCFEPFTCRYFKREGAASALPGQKTGGDGVAEILDGGGSTSLYRDAVGGEEPGWLISATA